MLDTAQPHPTVERISSRLIGVWTLVTYAEEKEGCQDTNPLGRKPEGFLISTPDGFVSAQLMKPGRSAFRSRDWHQGTPEEYVESGFSSGPKDLLAFSQPLSGVLPLEMARKLQRTPGSWQSYRSKIQELPFVIFNQRMWLIRSDYGLPQSRISHLPTNTAFMQVAPRAIFTQPADSRTCSA